MAADGRRLEIERHLGEIAAQRKVEVLYAVEAGSRAWGFASPDSDYDIRFIYRHEPKWYLSVRERRDVIELPLDERRFDVTGWDIRKALRLFLKSNPSLYEWLVSPIVYSSCGGVAEALRDLATKHYDRGALALHYRNLAAGQWKGHVINKDEVPAKKYLYVLRPLACLAWLCRLRTLPPIEFREVIAQAGLSAAAQAAVADLLDRKSVRPEASVGPRIAVLDDWIAATLDGVGASIESLRGEGPSVTDVDAWFLRWIGLPALAGT